MNDTRITVACSSPMSAKNIIVGEIRTILSRLRMNNRWRQEMVVRIFVFSMTFSAIQSC